MKKNDLILYAGLIIFGLAAPYLFSAFKVQLTYLCVLIVLAMTWNLQGGEMATIVLEIFFSMVLECT